MLLYLFILSIALQRISATDVICYYTNWAQYRTAPWNFLPEDIDVSLCDTVIYAFAQIKDHRLVAYEWNDEQMWPRVSALKAKKPNLKVLIAVGGWNQASYAFSPMASSAATRKIFIDSVMALLPRINFDGLDIDWEYPGLRGGSPSDKANLVQLCKELDAVFKPHNYILGLAIGAGPHHVDAGYDLDKLAPYVSHIGAMTYDFYVCGGSTIEHQAYLNGRPGIPDPYFSVSKSMEYMQNQGAPANKLVMGLPTYGRSYGTSNSNPAFGQHYNGQCPGYPYTGQGGIASYYEMCNLVNSGYQNRTDPSCGHPFIFGSNQFIGYDTPKLLADKVALAKSRGYKGVMIWALDFDDFRGQACGQWKYPLIREIYRAAKGTAPTVPPPVQTTTKDSGIITTTRRPGTGECQPGQMFYADRSVGCTRFLSCHTHALAGVCPAGLKFSNTAQVCDWPQNVQC